eukprot:2472850-Rhodomonas_salina.3
MTWAAHNAKRKGRKKHRQRRARRREQEEGRRRTSHHRQSTTTREGSKKHDGSRKEEGQRRTSERGRDSGVFFRASPISSRKVWHAPVRRSTEEERAREQCQNADMRQREREREEAGGERERGEGREGRGESEMLSREEETDRDTRAERRGGDRQRHPGSATREIGADAHWSACCTPHDARAAAEAEDGTEEPRQQAGSTSRRESKTRPETTALTSTTRPETTAHAVVEDGKEGVGRQTRRDQTASALAAKHGGRRMWHHRWTTRQSDNKQGGG